MRVRASVSVNVSVGESVGESVVRAWVNVGENESRVRVGESVRVRICHEICTLRFTKRCACLEI